MEGEGHRVGREALHLDLAARAAVHGVGVAGAEPGDVEVLGAAAHLLVGGEGDADRAVRDFGVGEQVLGRGDDLGDPRLVVGAEQGGARGGDDVVADPLLEIGDVGRAQDRGRIVRQHQVLPLVVAVDDRPDAGAAHLGRGVDVGDEADDRHLPLRRGGGDRRHDVAVLVERGVGEAEGAQLVEKVPQQVELLGRARIGVGGLA